MCAGFNVLEWQFAGLIVVVYRAFPGSNALLSAECAAMQHGLGCFQGSDLLRVGPFVTPVALG